METEIETPTFFEKIWESDIIYSLIGYGIMIIMILCIIILIKKYFINVLINIWKKWILYLYLDKNGTQIHHNKNTEFIDNLFENIEKKIGI